MARVLPKPKVPQHFTQKSIEQYLDDLLSDVFVDFVEDHKEIVSGDVEPGWQMSLNHHTEAIAKLVMRWYKDNKE